MTLSLPSRVAVDPVKSRHLHDKTYKTCEVCGRHADGWFIGVGWRHLSCQTPADRKTFERASQGRNHFKPGRNTKNGH